MMSSIVVLEIKNDELKEKIQRKFPEIFGNLERMLVATRKNISLDDYLSDNESKKQVNLEEALKSSTVCGVMCYNLDSDELWHTFKINDLDDDKSVERVLLRKHVFFTEEEAKNYVLGESSADKVLH